MPLALLNQRGARDSIWDGRDALTPKAALAFWGLKVSKAGLSINALFDSS